MPVTPTYPGVYIQELASDVRTIVPVDTATAAFIGRALRGPTNQPIICNSYADFERIFGGLWIESKLGYAVSDFFLNGGTKAVIVRVYRPAPDKEGKKALPARAQIALPLVDVSAQREALAKKALAVGAAQKALEAAKDDAEKTTNEEALKAAKQALDATQKALDEALVPPKQSTKTIEIDALYEGAWGDHLAVQVTREADARIRAGLARQYAPVSADAFFNLRIRDLRTGAEEYYPNVTLVESPRRLDRVLKAQSELARVAAPLDEELTTEIANTGSPAPGKRWWENSDWFATADAIKGSDGIIPTSNDITGEPEPGAESSGDDATRRGLQALDRADIFNMLCIPPYDGDDVPSNVLQAAAAYCEQRRAILIVDPPSGWTFWSKAKDGFPIPGLSPSANAALFFPRLMKQNPLRDNQVESFVPCGTIAGVIARTDFQRGVWKAPAGLEATLRGVMALSVPLNDAENGALNPLGINCLRVMPAAGPVVWGARTMEGDDRLASQWKYLPVRRMALWIEETLYRSTHWAVFEPNDEPLWSSLRLNIGNFMNGLFRQGAFQGRTPTEAYFVKCDASTTTQTDIDRGIVNVIVGFAPLKPAEFVIISIKQITNQGAAA